MDALGVIIIGAGAAGLTAARRLSHAGLSIALIEARNRIGGRIHTVYDPLSPVPIEFGAEFVHGKPPEIWRAVESGLPALELNMESDDFFDQVEEVLGRLSSAPEQSFAEFIEAAGVGEPLRGMVTGYIEGFNAARGERISVRALAQQEEAERRIEGGRIFRLQRGYRALVEWLWNGIERERLSLHLNTAVEAVRWRQGRVEVSARAFGREAKFKAPRAIVTLPLGVLQSGAVHFDPEPPALLRACEWIEMGHAARIVMRFRRQVWEDAGFLHFGGEWMPTWWTSLPVRAPVITAWTGGRAAEERAAESPDEWLNSALETLSHALGSDVTADLEAWHTHNWTADPFSRGAYSYVRAGGMDAQQEFGRPIEDTLYFAGEAVNAEGHSGTVHGAMATGEAAAGAILVACRSEFVSMRPPGGGRRSTSNGTVGPFWNRRECSASACAPDREPN